MTQYWDVNENGGLDVSDHEGTQLAADADWGKVWHEEYPDEIIPIVRDSMDGSQPSAYNQQLIADVTIGDIERGDPNE